ncbi:hypothetical protein J2Z21_003744 [Streptomyces griseochromogenes]|uniref:HTH merR-type domain-containing protein n=1 Tax=Streptomyces griseochromogenes TaxID=68214 RepID=A0A1B1ANW6_9ACTN|nr:MerR family transcriptional regulator [Streptomyces griseochromogenes]ANP48273.1 hypothetical protein AVL59_00635 [Streptomyces griseochromogenes]MBP2050794.1 hypothetical protein [Streptomyces griseochromogenes]
MSRRTGVPLHTLRTYERRRLIPALPEHGEAQIRRVELVRALLEVGGLGELEALRILGLLDCSDTTLSRLLGAVQYSLPTAGSASDDGNWARAEERAHALARARNWRVSEHNPAWRTLIQSFVVMEWLGQEDLLRLLDAYAEALEKVAEAEVRLVVERPDPESAVTRMVTATVIGDTVIAALRRLVHEHAVSRLECSSAPTA